jgi:hypothetical protein
MVIHDAVEDEVEEGKERVALEVDVGVAIVGRRWKIHEDDGCRCEMSDKC